MDSIAGSIKDNSHDEISPVILLSASLDYFFLACEIASNYQSRKNNDPISVLENTYATVSFLLLANSIEGYLNRLTYLEFKDCDAFSEVAKKTIDDKLLEFLKHSAIYKQLKEKFDEIYTVRSAITHSHIYLTGRTGDRVIIRKEKLILKQDERWKKTVDREFRTKKLKLNAIPSEINFDDIVKGFEFWDELYLEIKKYNDGIARLPSVHPHIFKRYTREKSYQDEIDNINPLESTFIDWIDLGKKIAKRK